jgi:hypothetical protein
MWSYIVRLSEPERDQLGQLVRAALKKRAQAVAPRTLGDSAQSLCRPIPTARASRWAFRVG